MSTFDDRPASFLGTGWSFPPRFTGGQAVMVTDETDIHESLIILFGTTIGERLFSPKYGLNMHELLFEPMSTTLRTLLLERIQTAILVYEPRIRILSLTVESPAPEAGQLDIRLDYLVRGTNSRFNLVYPFYTTDGNEARGTVMPPAGA